jgi:hypothetical protein
MSTSSPIPTLTQAQRQEPTQLQSSSYTNNDVTNNNNNNRSSLVCVTCHSTGSLRDSKLGNYTTDKFNAIYRELFPLFNGIDGSICGSCYKKCYHERLRRGMFQKRERANLVNGITIAAGTRKRKAFKILNNNNTTLTTETEISTTMTALASGGGHLSNETNIEEGMDVGTEDTVTKSRKKRKVTLISEQHEKQYADEQQQQQQTDQQQQQQPMRKKRRNRTNIVLSSGSTENNRQRMDSELSYHEDEEEDEYIEEDEQSDTSDENMVEVYFDFRLLSSPDERDHNPYRFNSINLASARPMKVIKSIIASQIPVTALKREAKFEMKESFEGKYKIMDIKLYEKDASGAIIEVDLIDDEFFMSTPVEYRTRFIVYVIAQM